MKTIKAYKLFIWLRSWEARFKPIAGGVVVRVYGPDGTVRPVVTWAASDRAISGGGL